MMSTISSIAFIRIFQEDLDVSSPRFSNSLGVKREVKSARGTRSPNETASGAPESSVLLPWIFRFASFTGPSYPTFLNSSSTAALAESLNSCFTGGPACLYISPRHSVAAFLHPICLDSSPLGPAANSTIPLRLTCCTPKSWATVLKKLKISSSAFGATIFSLAFKSFPEINFGLHGSHNWSSRAETGPDCFLSPNFLIAGSNSKFAYPFPNGGDVLAATVNWRAVQAAFITLKLFSLNCLVLVPIKTTIASQSHVLILESLEEERYVWIASNTPSLSCHFFCLIECLDGVLDSVNLLDN
mmetsp:Transcript_7870/g.17202  ORF Transcript_7870/g.17202 Transcript_7870/m.17202 type:complete len:300 (+) Transcript_7870:3937-4836(+)